MTTILERPLRIESGDMAFVPWIYKEAIQARVAQMAGHLAARFEGERVRLIPVLKGGRPFSALLLDEMTKLPGGPADITVDPIHVKSYQGITSRELNWLQRPELSARPDVHDIVVEDIADSARTLTAVEAALRAENPASLTTAVLLDRPEARAEGVSYQPDLVGFHIQNPDAWAIGFGLDLDEEYRDLPDICGRLGQDGELPPMYTMPAFPDLLAR
jgi:hypoxanthine phosphoribosyltransferase